MKVRVPFCFFRREGPLLLSRLTLLSPARGWYRLTGSDKVIPNPLLCWLAKGSSDVIFKLKQTCPRVGDDALLEKLIAFFFLRSLYCVRSPPLVGPGLASVILDFHASSPRTRFRIHKVCVLFFLFYPQTILYSSRDRSVPAYWVCVPFSL